MVVQGFDVFKNLFVLGFLRYYGHHCVSAVVVFKALNNKKR